MREALRRNGGDPRNIGMIIDNDYDLYQRAHNFARSTIAPADYKIAEELGQSVGDYLASLSEPQLELAAKRSATGEDLVNLYKGREADFAKAGIHGARFYDQLSRGAGDGTRNYVVFNPDIIDITGRY